jgi:hypothetical protein
MNTGVIMYGAPGTGKTLMARACAAQTNACFLKLAGPQLVQVRRTLCCILMKVIHFFLLYCYFPINRCSLVTVPRLCATHSLLQRRKNPQLFSLTSLMLSEPNALILTRFDTMFREISGFKSLLYRHERFLRIVN